MQDSYQTVRGTLRITRLITVTVTLSSTNSPIKGAESHRTKPCGYIVMMTTSPRHICLSVLAVSANPQTVMRDTHTQARSHTHTHTSELSLVSALFSVWQPRCCHWWTTAAPSPSAHSSSSPPTCGGITCRNVDPAVLHPAGTSLTTSSAGVRHHEGGGG